MEVQQHQGLEMAQVTSTLFDIFHPTPVSLKQLSAIAISVELWRRRVNEYRTGRKLQEFNPWILREQFTWIKEVLPVLPATIYKTIEEVFSRFGQSFGFWRSNHCSARFSNEYRDVNDVLNDFDDFVCDYDGSIDYTRTAERMMGCEGFNSEKKFVIACTYFLEDDIRRIWPSISRNVDVDLIDFDKCPLVYYWIYRLTNKLDKIPTPRSETVAERMFTECSPYNRPSLEYFWNRMPHETRTQRAVDYLDRYNFVRFILTKLDDEQLDKFVSDGYGDVLYATLINLHCDESIVLRTWLQIRDIIKESNFIDLIIRMFGIQNYDIIDEHYDEYEEEKWKYLCCQIWNHSPRNLKRSVIRVFSSDSAWFKYIVIDNDDDFCEVNVELLLLILRDAFSTERNLFWCKNWSYVIEAVRCKYLQRVIELCFENKGEVDQFKQNVLVKSKDVFKFCVWVLESACFEELNGLVSFVCTELQAARNFKRSILQSAFLDEYCGFSVDIVSRIVHLNEFINDAFDNVDVSTDFKNLLLSSSPVVKRLSRIICSDRISFETLVKFIDTLVSTEESVMRVKKGLIDSLKEQLTINLPMSGYHNYLLSDPELNSILSWCLGSNEVVEEFKLNCAL